MSLAFYKSDLRISLIKYRCNSILKVIIHKITRNLIDGFICIQNGQLFFDRELSFEFPFALEITVYVESAGVL